MNNINEKVEAFVVLSTVESLELANRITGVFEDLGIPVLLEHVDLDNELSASAFRISTQSQFAENASRIVENMLSAQATRRLVSAKESFQS